MIKQIGKKKSKIIMRDEESRYSDIYLNQNLLQKLVKVNTRIQQQIRCQCILCQRNYNTKLKRVTTYQRLEQSKQTMLLKKNNFKLLLNYLTNSKKSNFKVLIPQICFYQNGQPQTIFITFKDEIRQIKNQPLTQLQVLNTFLEQNKLYKDMLQQIFQKQIIKYIDLSKQIHQKYVQLLLPPWKPGGSQIQKGGSSLKFHKDDRLLMDRIEQNKDKDSDYICIVRYFDGTFQLLNESQFKNLMKNSKNTEIQLIQSYIKPKRETQSILICHYDKKDKLQNKQLYDKALLQIEIQLEIIPQVSELYITKQTLQQFNQSLKVRPQDYILYQTYKIIHYLEKTIDLTVQKIKLNWTLNDVNLFFIDSVIQFVFQSNNYQFISKFNKKQLKQIKTFQQIQNKLKKRWEQKKKQKNINNNYSKIQKYNRSHQIFSILYPKLKFQDLINKQTFAFQKQVNSLTTTTRQSFQKSHNTSRRSKRTNRTKIWCKQIY